MVLVLLATWAGAGTAATALARSKEERREIMVVLSGWDTVGLDRVEDGLSFRVGWVVPFIGPSTKTLPYQAVAKQRHTSSLMLWERC